jgi:hypothetical protein
MSTWQISVLFAMAGCAIGCLIGICIAIERLVKGIVSIEAELTKMNSKLESVEATKGDEAELESIEAAVSGFEKLKRIDLTGSLR